MSRAVPRGNREESYPNTSNSSGLDRVDGYQMATTPPSYREEIERTQSFYSSNQHGRDRDVRSTDLGESTIATDDVADEVARLYLMCEQAIARPEDQGTQLTPMEVSRRKELLEETWNNIREWLTAHPVAEERHLAATHLGHFSTTALHLVCKLTDPPADIVKSLILCSPETATWQDSNGWLPLHHACANGASGEVLKILCDYYPDGKTTQDRRRRTPLHFAFFRSDAPTKQRTVTTFDEADDDDGEFDGEDDPSSNGSDAAGVSGGSGGTSIGNSMAVIVGLLSDSGAAQRADEGGMLPMHYACAYGTNTDVLTVLKDVFPESIVARENKGRTPLHLAMVNAHRSASPRVLRFLLSEGASDVVNLSDNDGNLPLHLLALSARFSPEQAEARQNAADCLRQYLNAQPHASADFFSALQALPEWLRDKAVVSGHVHNVLNDKIAKRFPTSILLVDGYMLLMIIVAFEYASTDHIKNRFDDQHSIAAHNTATLIVILVGGTYFLLREVIQIISLLNLGTFRSWLFDPVNWLDMTLIFCCFYFFYAMLDEDYGIDPDAFRSGVAFAKGVMWISVITYLKSTLVDFAVFVGGVFYVVQRLLAFLVALVVILLAFAQMFFMVFFKTPTCINRLRRRDIGKFIMKDEEQLEYFPHCTFEDSLLKVYTMLMGEVGNAEERYDTNVSQVLYLTFAFVVVIILSNVLIAIVTDSYGVIKNERAAMVFWSSRLDFVAEMDGIANVLKRIPNLFRCCRKGRNGSGSNQNVQETSGQAIVRPSSGNLPAGDDGAVSAEGRGKGRMRSWWDTLMSLFDPNLVGDFDVHPGSIEFWLTYMFRFVAIVFIIPMWLLAGFVTAGWLWPPQVREWLFVQKQAAISRADIAEQVTNELDLLKNEIKTLRIELRTERKGDRRELNTIKGEVDQVQREIISDLAQVKEIMVTLLDLSKANNNNVVRRDLVSGISTGGQLSSRHDTFPSLT